jgi:hypothetical protein
VTAEKFANFRADSIAITRRADRTGEDSVSFNDN